MYNEMSGLKNEQNSFRPAPPLKFNRSGCVSIQKCKLIFLVSCSSTLYLICVEGRFQMRQIELVQDHVDVHYAAECRVSHKLQ